MLRATFVLAFCAAVAVPLFSQSELASSTPAATTSAPATMDDVPEVTISRLGGARGLAGFLTDEELQAFAAEVQGVFKGRAWQDVTIAFLAGELAETHDSSELLPAGVEYREQKNVLTCEMEVICIWEQVLVVSDVGQADPFVVHYRVVSEI